MKNKFLLILILLIGCNKNTMNWSQLNFNQAINNNSQFITMVYFYTDW